MAKRLLSALLLLFPLWLGAAVTGPAALFTQETLLPQGVAVDAEANVHVYHDAVLFNAVSRFLADGTRQALLPVGAFAIPTGGRLLPHPAREALLLLLSSGEILELDPTSGAVSVFLDLRALPLDAAAVFDVSLGHVRNFSGAILAGRIAFGDITAHRAKEALELFVSGISVNTPFVARIRVADGRAGPLQILVASVGTPGTNNVTRGVAANAQGTVLTTLPVAVSAFPGLQEQAVAFAADYAPEVAGSAPPRALFGGADLTSRGMATDGAGNFYIASGARGASACGVAASGALVAVPADLGGFTCHTLDLALADSIDVAVSPNNDRVYMTLLNLGSVVVFPLAVEVPAAAADRHGQR